MYCQDGVDPFWSMETEVVAKLESIMTTISTTATMEQAVVAIQNPAN